MNTTTEQYTIAISKEELATLPKLEYNGPIYIVDTDAEMKKAARVLKRYDILGFDTESKPTFRKGAAIHVSLIQIAAEDVCFLFRIRKFLNIEPLKEIIESPDILKVGLSLHDDFKILSHDYNLKPQGFADLQKMVLQYQFANTSLQKIYAILFDKRISKSQQLSNWNAQQLSDAQINYAAIDAWSCIHIYKKLASGDFNPETSKYKKPIETETHEN